MKRLANIELLRGVLMLMVVLVHLTGNSILNANTPLPHTELNWIISNIIDSFCYPAVNCFILISGYFGMRPTFKKFLKLDLPVVMYGILLFVLLGNYGTGTLLQSLFPVIMKQYWFLVGYVLLMLTAPLINIFVEKVSKNEFYVALILPVFLFVIIPSFTPICFADARGMDFVNFTLLYMIGRYMKVYGKQWSGKFGFTLYIVSTLLILICTLLFAYKLGINNGWKSRFYAYNNILVYFQAIGLLIWALKWRINERASKVINYLSPSFFYIYIIHEAPLLKPYMYQILHFEDYYYSHFFSPYLLLSAISIFVASLAIDILLRRIMLGRVIDSASELGDKLYNKSVVIIASKMP